MPSHWRRALEEFEHAFHIALRDERHTIVGNEALVCQQASAREGRPAFGQTGDVDRAQIRVEEQHAGGVHAQLRGDLIEDDAQSEPQIEAAGDGGVNGAQGGEALHVALGLFVQGGALDGVGGHVGNRREQAGLIGRDVAGIRE